MTDRETPEQMKQAPPDVFVLLIGDQRIGWTRGHHIGFSGFADVNVAGSAAWVANVALARRRDRKGGATGAMSDVPTLSVRPHSDGEWIFCGDQALARLIRPGTSTPVTDGVDTDDAPHGWWSIEIELSAMVSELDVTSAAYVIHRGLRVSGLAWEALNSFRDRAGVSSAWQSAPPVPAAHPVEHEATNRLREWRRRFAFAWSHSAIGRALHF